ncbi:MAG: biosynthetic-type acetolactate synthase large subunit, partial [Nitrospinota bacterium]
MKLKGAEIIIKSLEAEGVEYIFGFPGAVLVDLLDCFFESPIRHILARHEQCAGHAADGYARATGKPGVCLTTSGPGATNLVTAVATAFMDSSPLIALTGQVGTDLVGSDAFQEADIVGITRSITKHSYLVKDVGELAQTIKEAFHIATSGRPGPVLIDLPKDVLKARAEFNYPSRVSIRGYKPTLRGHPKQIERVAQTLKKASRPVLYTGGGVIHSGASKELLYLAETTSTPVTSTLLGLGCFPGDHPLFLGMLGMHGTAYANYAVSHSDLLIAVGARFDDRVTGKIENFAPGATIVHLDIDPAAISKNVKVDLPVVGDAKNILGQLNKLIEPRRNDLWLKQIRRWRQEHPLEYDDGDGETIKPQHAIQELSRLLGSKATITTEVGQHQMWTAQYYTFTRPRQFITSGGLGTMGFGFPAALGAQLGSPGSLVVDIAGDGSFQMVSQELATAVQYRLPVKVLILNNRFLGMVRQWQDLFM